MNGSHDQRPKSDYPGTPTEAELRAAMEQSDRDVAAKHTVPLAELLAELENVADRIEARRRARRA